MTTYQFFTTAWTWNSILILLSALAFVGYLLAFRRRGRPVYFAAALVVFLLAFMSPFSALANGYLFSAHMVQHILLVLIVPALLLLSLPRPFSLRPPLTYLTHPLIGWNAGVGAMWLWHAPSHVEECLSDSNDFPSINGNGVLVAGPGAARRATAFTACRNCLPVYRLHCLQRARHYPDLCASFDLSGFPTPGRSIGNPQHDPRQLGPDE
jgi:hypothetical protein